MFQQCRAHWATERDDDRGLGFDELIDEALAARSFVSFVDPDDPTFTRPLDMPLAINDFCRQTDQPVPESRGAVVRCIMESLSFKTRVVLEQLREIFPQRISRIHIVGGGAQNALLCRFTANACGIPVWAGPVEATSIGNLLVQAMSAGLITSLGRLRRVVANSFPIKVFEPQDQDEWESAWRRFQALL
jgi:rhamnulokinase